MQPLMNVIVLQTLHKDLFNRQFQSSNVKFISTKDQLSNTSILPPSDHLKARKDYTSLNRSTHLIRIE